MMIESLEARALLAGDVTAVFSRGALTLRGDNSGNQVTVEADGAGGVRVTGQDGTTLNGQAGPLTFAEITRDLRVTLKGGDDRLTVSGLTVGRDVNANAGGGADAVTIDGGRVGRRLTIKGGSAGAKAVTVRAAEVAGPARVGTGSGADAVDLSDSTFAGRVTVNTGRGDDAVIRGPAFPGGLRVNDGPGTDAVSLRHTFDFRRGDQGWVGGFADYPAGFQGFDDEGRPAYPAEEYYELRAGLAPLPPELNDPGTGFLLRGDNHSDDLFMFLKRRLGPADGIVPGQQYQVTFEIAFASNAPSGALGVGGPPGEGVFLKAGAGAVEPMAVLNTAKALPPLSTGYFEMNVGHGLQEGSFTSTIGHIANGLTPEEASARGLPYVSLHRTHAHNAIVSPDATGNLWLLNRGA